MTLTLTRLQYGWVDCCLSHEDRSLSISGSYLSDALGELVESALAVLEEEFWDKDENRSICIWWNEPGQHQWHFSRQEVSLPAGMELRIAVEIRWFDTGGIPRKSDRGTRLFHADCLPRHFAAQIYELFTPFLESGETGANDYRQRWGHPLPLAALRLLQEYLKGVPAASEFG